MNCKIKKTSDGNNKIKASVIVKKVHVVNSVLVRLTGGHAWVELGINNVEVVELNQGEVIFIEKGQYISFFHEKKSEEDHFQIIELNDEVLIELFPIMSHLSPVTLAKKVSRRIVTYYKIKDKPYISHVFFELNGVMRTRSELGYKEYLHSVYYVLSFFTCLQGFVSVIERTIKVKYCDKLYNIIINDINNKWTLELCASILYVSVSTLKRRLAMEGKSFREVYLDARMNASLILLRTTKLSISDIAIESGFRSCSSFSTTFKKYFGVSPKRLSLQIHY
ncbi:helix-turn-helix domain-containing protein [Hafnia paralvei]|uniref:helix-turn-helix domain-containing protein n=1 Tax=Hafnia paralvei TaxID=546367 RepID=UPI000BB59915|nr:helix-turn-helix domain-containing protein [Hafnia paralvei]MCE9919443.1 helix-turn-helix domain-containing protein [Hafnia paralvei]MCE9948966.1 helix-turn-helix domain-containing protein [Hafnia paralvei]NIH31818.1 helix-turn-helix domain-containing protein [Hafnia paralvei]PNK67741.1 hypothetical protein A6J69_012140 [Hafnia paralvei]